MEQQVNAIMKDFEEIVEEFREKIVPQIFSKDLLPGHTRATLTQVEKHIMQLSRNQSPEDISLILFAYGIILGDTMVKTIEGAKWVYDAPSLQYLRIRMPVPKENEKDEDVYALPILRVINLFNTKNVKDKGIVMYYDTLKKECDSQKRIITES